MQGSEGKTADKVEDSSSSIKKEWRIVAWSGEEDDLLREQIGLHGTGSWTMIASPFKDKTPRQCRRRWYTYLNSDFKRGGWTPEEDMLLCKAQRVFGNRWTEIAKVVSGRTDNAVKNRFTTLCKKTARYETSAKENGLPFINSNNKRVISSFNGRIKGALDDIRAPKRVRLQARGTMEIYNLEDRLHVPKKTTPNQSIRSPLVELAQSINEQNFTKPDNKEIQGTFLSKDDMKFSATMQRAELFGSLVVKVNEESTAQTLENAWKVLEDFLNQNKDGELNKENTLVLPKGSSSVDNRSQIQKTVPATFREPELCDESSICSECSTGSAAYQLPAHDETDEADKQEQASNLTNAEFGSPLKVTPVFRSLAAGIPSPKFSESERNFIMKTLGMESPLAAPSTNPSHNPACKRSLLQQL